jgi:uncharacterized tellurite resistance protein B-like protein
MKTALIVFTVLLVVPPLVGLAVYYWRYRTSPAFRWKQDVLRHARALRAHQARVHNQTSGLDQSLARLADEAFTRLLRTVPLDRLAEFPNIGPATVGKLEDAGYRRLADAVDGHFEYLPGIGPARANDLRTAVRKLVREARSRFDAGACPEAQEYRRRVDQLRQADRERLAARDRELAAIDAALDETLDLVPIAESVTFWEFVLHREIAGLTPEVLERPLPEPRIDPVSPPPVAHTPPPEPPAVPMPVAVEVRTVPRATPVSSPSVPRAIPVPKAPAAPIPSADIFRAELDQPARPKPAPAPVDVKQAYRDWIADVVPTEPPGLARMRVVVGLGYVVAKADGKVAQAEREAIRAFLEQSFGHDPVLLRHIDPLMERTEKLIPDADDALDAIRAAVPAAERGALYQWAERIADASGERNQRERDILARIAAALEVSAVPEPVPQDRAPLRVAAKQEDDPRAVLDIAPGVPLDADLIRRRFALLTDKLDPTKAAAFGPEFARMAEEKRARVRAAAEALIAPFNEPLERPTAPPPTDLRHNPDLDDVFGA